MIKSTVYFLTTLLLAASTAVHAQRIETEHEVVDLGQVVYNRPVTATYELQNTGRKPLVLSSVRTSCGCTTVSYPQQAIAPNQSFKVSVTYDARTMGHFNKLVELYSNASDLPLTLNLRGQVVEEITDYKGTYKYEVETLSVDDMDIEFDDVNRADRPYQTIHIFNRGTSVLTPQVMHLPPYLKADVSPSQLAPQHGGSITLQLDPSKLRDLGLTQTSIFLGLFPGDRVSPEKEITVSAVLLPSFSQLTPQQMATAPRLILSADTIQMGAFGSRSKLKSEITLTNEGQSTLHIQSLQMFTVGVGVKLKKSQIAPGESVKMKITAVARQLRKARTLPRILLITNDPQRPKVVLPIVATEP